MTDKFRLACHKHLSKFEYARFFKIYERLLAKTKRNPSNISSFFDLIEALLNKRREHINPNLSEKSTFVGLLDAKIIQYILIANKLYLDSSKLCLVIKILAEIGAVKALKNLFLQNINTSEDPPMREIIVYFYQIKDFQSARYFAQLLIRRFSHIPDCWALFYNREKFNDAPDDLLTYINNQARNILQVEDFMIFQNLTGV